MNLASETEENELVEPLNVSPELNIERLDDELKLKIVIGSGINWDNYKVVLNGTEVKTTSGKISFEGDFVYFNYKGGVLVRGEFYTLEILDLKAQSVVYSEDVLAESYKPEGTGIYGHIISSRDGSYLANVEVSLSQDGQPINYSTSEFSDTYSINVDEGTYEIKCEHISSVPGMEYYIYIAEVNITKYVMLRYDIIMELKIPLSSSLTGFVYDNATKNPMTNIDVRVSDFKTVQKNVMTDSKGYYYFYLQPMEYTIICELKGYVLFRDTITLEENQTLTYDIYLDPIPPQTGLIKGYVYDQISGDPIVGEDVFSISPYLKNYTITDEAGYFQINVVPGDVTVFVNIIDYELWENDYTIDDYGTELIYIYLVREKGG